MMCFAPDCKHYNEKHMCKFFTFPKDPANRRRWIKLNSDTSKKGFSCGQRPSGYYADLETGCQVYHMCDGLGRQFSYSCPNATLFQQRMLICDHWYMVNCSKSEVDYRANLLIGQRDKPFLEDSEKHPYHRTPRPDLLRNIKMPEYNLMQRTGRSQLLSNFNLVGIETDYEHNRSSTTDRPSYSLPSHWFTKYSNTTRKHEDKSLRTKSKHTKITDNSNIKIVDDNYKTKLKYLINENIKFQDTTEQPAKQNHLSQVSDTQSHNLDMHPRISNSHKSNDMHLRITSKKTSGNNHKTGNADMHWQDLRKLFLIPDYEFPLDSASRPGYENGQSSFEVNASLPIFYNK